MNKPLTPSELETSVEIVSSQAVRAAAKKKMLRKKLFAGLFAGIAVAGGTYYAYDTFIASRYVTTDNAYVGAETAQVTPLVGGPVKEVRISDTDTVKQGDVLVVLDDSDAILALAQAEAAFGQAERRVRGYFANNKGLAAQVASRAAAEAHAAADTVAAESALERARIDLSRREALASSGSVSGEELTTAQNAFRQAQAALDAARANQVQATANREAAIGSMKANAVLVEDTTVQSNPEVAAARSRLEQAKLDLERTLIRAPISGVIVKRDVQVGQKVQAGSQLMSIVPIQQAYVDANFKEVQLTKVHEGQEVRLTSDLYGSDIVFRGRVVGLSGGTGSSFALIPAQNATGNWIKVVQRLPVRIALDHLDLAQHPLRVGLSMQATIDTKH